VGAVPCRGDQQARPRGVERRGFGALHAHLLTPGFSRMLLTRFNAVRIVEVNWTAGSRANVVKVKAKLAL
jgi:hypothetical protein